MKSPARETTVAASRLCRFPGCDRPGDHARGMCESCYRGTASYVADGVISWERLEQRGKVAQRKMTLKEWLLS